MEISTLNCQRLFLTGSLLLLFFATSSDAIVNETLSGLLFTLPDSPTSNQKSRDEAQKWCLSNNNTLAEIYNSQIQDIVARFLNKKTFGNWNFWMIGIRTPTSWSWVNERDIGGINVLNQTFPNNSYSYLQFDPSGFSIYAALSMETKGGFICEGSSYCNGGFSYNSRCYRANIAGSSLTWYEARNECLNGGGDLASFDFINDDQSLKNLTRQWISSSYSSTPLWIGLTRQRWIWQGSNTTIKYTNWDTGHPSTLPSCLILTPSQWKWVDSDCTSNQIIFCLQNIDQLTTTKLPSDISTTSKEANPTLSNSEFSAVTKNTSSDGNNNPDIMALGVGIGVGVGGFLVIVIVVVVVVLLIKKRRSSSGNSQSQKRLKTPDILSDLEQQKETDNYAQVQQKTNDIEMKVDDSKTIYSEVLPSNN